MANPFDQYDEKPAAKAANPFDRYDQPEKSAARRAFEGAALGIADIGNTALNALTYLPGKVSPAIAQWQRTKNADFEALTEENKDSTAFKVGRVGANIGATLPVGGAIAGALSKIPAVAAGASPLLNAIRTGGFVTGSAPTTLAGRAADLGIRAAGGAITGGASSGLINPGEAGSGAVVGALLPPSLAAAGKGLDSIGRAGYSVAQPFTKKGQERLAGSVLNNFAKEGPTNLDLAEYVAGSVPTLAEATNNAGIARLQSLLRDVRPNLFVERERANAAARDAAFDRLAGDKGMRDAAIEARDDAASALYDRAFGTDAMRRDLARSSQQMRAPFSGVGLSGAPEDLATPGLRALAQRPQFQSAIDDARKLAANNGVRLDDPLQSLQGLHYVKLALDDALNPAAKSAMGRNASGAVMGMRDKLADELAQVSPLYGNARQTFAEMSKPINAMEALQGLNITDAKGNITLTKVQSAIMLLERRRNKPGVDAAKAVTDEQMSALYGLRDDLRRQANVDAGKSRGASTLQNVATDNIISSVLPGRLGEMATNKAGGLVGQFGRLAYSGPNEAIRSRLAELALDPSAGTAAMGLAGTPVLDRAVWPSVSAAVDSSLSPLLPLAYRLAPPIATSQ